MKKDDLKVELPPSIVEQVHLKAGDTVKLTVNKNDIIIKPLHNNNISVWDISLWWSTLPGIISGVIFYLFFFLKSKYQVPLISKYSIASATIIMGFIFGTILFAVFFAHNRNNKNKQNKRIYWRTFPTIVLSFSVVLLVSLLGVFGILGTAFNGVSFDLFTATFIVMVFLGFVSYFMISAAVSLTPVILTNLLTIMIIGGVIVSMFSNSTRYWWRHNLSFLGTHYANDSWQFNFTLIFAAILMLTLIDYLFVYLKLIYKINWRVYFLYILLSLFAVSLGLVGFFPNNYEYHILHKFFAGMLVLIILSLIGGIRWLWPNISKGFLHFSNATGIMLIIICFLFQGIHYLSLTAFELVEFLISLIWLFLLFQIIQSRINESGETFKVKVN